MHNRYSVFPSLSFSYFLSLVVGWPWSNGFLCMVSASPFHYNSPSSFCFLFVCYYVSFHTSPFTISCIFSSQFDYCVSTKVLFRLMNAFVSAHFSTCLSLIMIIWGEFTWQLSYTIWIRLEYSIPLIQFHNLSSHRIPINSITFLSQFSQSKLLWILTYLSMLLFQRYKYRK